MGLGKCSKCGSRRNHSGTQCTTLHLERRGEAAIFHPNRRLFGARTVLLLLLGVLTLSVGLTGYAIPWVQNQSQFLRTSDVGLELGIGANSSNWVFEQAKYTARVVLPHSLSDTAMLKLEFFADEKWWGQEVEAITSSTMTNVFFTFRHGEQQRIRLALYSGEKLIQISEEKVVRGSNKPESREGEIDNILWRYLSDSEERKIPLTTANCGTSCWLIALSAPNYARVTVWKSIDGKPVSKKVSVTLTEVGKFRSVIVPATLRNTDGSIWNISSRPATASEVMLAGMRPEPIEPKPESNPTATKPSYCNTYSALLDEKSNLEFKLNKNWAIYEQYKFAHIEGDIGGMVKANTAASAINYLQSELSRVNQQINRCNN